MAATKLGPLLANSHLGPTFTWSVAANDSVNFDTLEASCVDLIGATARAETLKLARTLRTVQAPLWSATASGALLNSLLGYGKAPRLAPLRSTTASGALLNFLLGYGKAAASGPRQSRQEFIHDLRQQRARFAVILVRGIRFLAAIRYLSRLRRSHSDSPLRCSTS
ncbi:hypothetical protein MRX96_025526 [Rhipicephalus microplus]